MASSSSEIQTPINCQFCETEKLIKWKCIDCELLICDKCKDKIHLKIKGGQEHRILDIKEIGDQPEELDFTNLKCQEHSGNNKCLFCKTCDILVCPVCIAKLHKMHDLVEIQEEYNVRISRLRQGQGKVQRYKIKLDTDLNHLKQIQTADHSKYSKVKEDILAQEKSLNDALRKYALMLIDELDEHKKAISESTDMNAVSISKKCYDEKYTEVEEFIRVTDVSKFFKEVNKMERSIDFLDPVPEPKLPVQSIPFFVPGTITQSHFGKLTSENPNTDTDVKLTVNAVYQTELSRVATLFPCPDGSLWITNNSDDLLQKVIPEGTNMKVIAEFNHRVTAIAITKTGDILVKVFKKDGLQQLNITNAYGFLSDSVYNLKPLIITSIHVTSDNKVIVGVTNKLQEGALVVMDEAGNQKIKYEHGQHKQQMFTYPLRLTSTNIGNIHVIDGSPNSDIRRVVVIGQNGDLINTYTGHEAINKTVPFRPVDLVKTARDNVILVDRNTDTLHITNNMGHLIAFFKTEDIEIENPFSLAIGRTGQLYIGCTQMRVNTSKEAKIYEVNMSGC